MHRGTKLANASWSAKIDAAHAYQRKWDAALKRHDHDALENQRCDSFSAMLQTIETIHKTPPKSLIGVQVRLLAVGYLSHLSQGEGVPKLYKLVADLEHMTGRILPYGLDSDPDAHEAPAISA